MACHEIGSDDDSIPKNFYYWKDIYPELSILHQNQAIIAEECKNINTVSFFAVICLLLYQR